VAAGLIEGATEEEASLICLSSEEVEQEVLQVPLAVCNTCLNGSSLQTFSISIILKFTNSYISVINLFKPTAVS
jgi:hypothetical protein